LTEGLTAPAEVRQLIGIQDMTPITKDDLARLFNCRLTLIDKKVVQHFVFSRNGYVAVTMGVKNGPIAGPMMYWSLTGKGHLRITSNRRRLLWSFEKPYQEWKSIQFNADTASIETIAGPQIYNIETRSETNKD
jgi:hypothetical protein